MHDFMQGVCFTEGSIREVGHRRVSKFPASNCLQLVTAGLTTGRLGVVSLIKIALDQYVHDTIGNVFRWYDLLPYLPHALQFL